MICLRLCYKSKATGATPGVGTATLPEHTRSPPVLVGFLLLDLLFLCSVLCIIVFPVILFSLATYDY